MEHRHSLTPAAFIILIKGHQVLLSRRFNTGYRDGEFGLPSGHIEKDETPREGAIREAKEEIGLTLKVEDLEFSTHMYRLPEKGPFWVDWYFICRKWEGTPINAEPHKCSEITWFDVDNLPENTIPYAKEAIQLSLKGIPYSEWTWEKY